MKVWRTLRIAICCFLTGTSIFLPLRVNAGLPDTVDRIRPAVVLVGTFGVTDSPRFSFRGTGFVVGSGSLVVTNAHVLPDSASINTGRKIAIQVWAEFNQWSVRLARPVAIDKMHDLALLKFEGVPVVPLQLSDSKVREGSSIAFMGFPIGGALGYSHVTHRGIVSSVAAIALPAPSSTQLNTQSVHQLRQGAFDIFQLDATAYPGNSGGPIFDVETGLVLGVINSVLVKGSRESALTHPSGISYGIPAAHVLRLIGENP